MSGGLSRFQHAFSQAARGHVSTHALPFDERGLAIYRELLLNNLNEVISPCFPVLLTILPVNTWWQALKNFLKNHSVSTPIFHELPRHMVDYLQAHPIPAYPFAAALAHYEWIELEVELCEPSADTPVQANLNLLEQIWQIAPTARLLKYDYEVEKISLDYQPQQPCESYLLVYQTKGDVEFIKLNEMSFQLITMMIQEQVSATTIIHLLCEMHSQLNESQLMTACLPLISQLFEEGALLPL